MSFVREILVRGTRGGMAIALVSSLVSVTLTVAPSGAAFPQTLENLQTALNGERNAHLRYLAFAEKADQEGDGAASLFRAAAAAEQVHGNNHEQVIRQLGGSPNLRLDTPVVKSTRENLEAAVNGESYKHQKMYPEFIGQARKGAYVPAIVTLTQAKNTEQEHARLFSEALNNLDRLKDSLARTYYVSAVCGFTTEDLNFERCKKCFKPKEKYKAVS